MPGTSAFDVRDGEGRLSLDRHPSHTELAEYCAGIADGTLTRSVNEHVAECADCLAVVVTAVREQLRLERSYGDLPR